MAAPAFDLNPEPRNTVVKRRIWSIGRSVLLLGVLTVGAPLWLAIAAIVDVVRGGWRGVPPMAVRMLAFAWVWLVMELAGVARMGAHWVAAGFGRRRAAMVERAWGVQAWWSRTLLAATKRLFRLSFVVHDDDLATPGPVITMFRHASIVDNLLPAALLTDLRGLRLRWIVKRELLAVACLDVAGKRLPNYFVDRNSADPRRELRSITSLASNLGRDEGVLIFPEGTRFTPQRQARAIASLEKRSPDLAARAARLRHVMPPKVGGVLTLLGTGADVLICGHHGLEGFAKLRDIWSGAMVGRTVTVRFWRLPAATIPADRPGRIAWLFDQWESLDEWIDTLTVKAAPGH